MDFAVLDCQKTGQVQISTLVNFTFSDSDSLDTEDEIQLIQKSANLQLQQEPVLKQATWATARTGPEPLVPRAKSLPKESAEDASHCGANVWQGHSPNDYEEQIRIGQVD